MHRNTHTHTARYIVWFCGQHYSHTRNSVLIECENVPCALCVCSCFSLNFRALIGFEVSANRELLSHVRSKNLLPQIREDDWIHCSRRTKTNKKIFKMRFASDSSSCPKCSRYLVHPCRWLATLYPKCGNGTTLLRSVWQVSCSFVFVISTSYTYIFFFKFYSILCAQSELFLFRLVASCVRCYTKNILRYVGRALMFTFCASTCVCVFVCSMRVAVILQSTRLFWNDVGVCYGDAEMRQ